jgi:hypothetical protein
MPNTTKKSKRRSTTAAAATSSTQQRSGGSSAAALSANSALTTTTMGHHLLPDSGSNSRISGYSGYGADMIKGSDDVGNYYNSQNALAACQDANRALWYRVNADWWISGYGGRTDDEAMIGDEGGQRDAEEGLAFLDRLLLLLQLPPRPGTTAAAAAAATTTSATTTRGLLAIDVGAGVGRITKHVLLKRYDQVHLVEGDIGWSKRSRVYLGKKRAARCTFTCRRLEDITPGDFLSTTTSTGADLIWLQWTLQYLTDRDAVALLINLAAGLAEPSSSGGGGVGGFLIVKENRPYGTARTDRFQMDTPAGNGRYDITRTDVHHRWLLQQAGLTIVMTEQGEETNTYAVVVAVGDNCSHHHNHNNK